MSDKLKVGIIGTGIIGKSHVRNYQSMQNDVEIVAVADIDESEAQTGRSRTRYSARLF